MAHDEAHMWEVFVGILRGTACTLPNSISIHDHTTPIGANTSLMVFFSVSFPRYVISSMQAISN